MGAFISIALTILMVSIVIRGMGNHDKRIIVETDARMSELARFRQEQIEAEERAKEEHRRVVSLLRHRELESALRQAEMDIENIYAQMDAKSAYGIYLETERDACVYGSKYWHGWNNKLNTHNNQMYTLEKKLNKAIDVRDGIKYKMEEVA